MKELEHLRAAVEATHPDTLIVESLRQLAVEAQHEAAILDGPGVIPTIPVSQFIGILRGEVR